MGIFGFGGIKLRCPYCGKTDKHKKLVKSQEEIELNRMAFKMMPEGSSLKRLAAEIPDNDDYECSNCSHKFSMGISKTWKDISIKLDEETALSEYRSLEKPGWFDTK